MNQPERSDPTLTIAVACLATAMLMLDISVINTALSDIASGLDTGLSGLQWVVDAYTIPLAATVLTAGAIADRRGRRRLFIIGLSIFTASSALCGAAGGIEVLVGSRAIQGLGASLMFATALALISQVTPDRESRVKALAAYGAAIGAWVPPSFSPARSRKALSPTPRPPTGGSRSAGPNRIRTSIVSQRCDQSNFFPDRAAPRRSTPGPRAPGPKPQASRSSSLQVFKSSSLQAFLLSTAPTRR